MKQVNLMDFVNKPKLITFKFSTFQPDYLCFRFTLLKPIKVKGSLDINLKSDEVYIHKDVMLKLMASVSSRKYKGVESHTLVAEGCHLDVSKPITRMKKGKPVLSRPSRIWLVKRRFVDVQDTRVFKK